MKILNRAKKVITIMLALAMVFALMPQLPGTDSTAFATPTSGLFLSTSNMSGDGYKYNGSTHVLELNGYGASGEKKNNLYFTGVSETKNQIILSGSNSINLTSQTGTGNIEGIYSGSELRIAGDGSLLIQINANMLYNQGLTGIFANKKLTITERAQVTIIINSTSVDKGNTTYGIKAMGGISVESGASLDIRIEDCGKSYPVYGIYNYGGEINISGNQKKSIKIAGGSSGYGIYNYSYSTAEGNGNIRISGVSNAEASVDITMNDGADNFHVGIMSDKGSNKLNNTTGVISISSKTVNISGTERGIVNASAARNTADIAINDSKLTITGTENGIISYQNGASFDNSVVNITASGIAADFSNYDGFKNRSDYGLCISGGSKVNLISESTTAVRTYSTSDTGAVSTIDLKNGGHVEVTAANNDAGNKNAWRGFVKLGSTTDFEKGNWGGDSHSLDSDARGCVSIPSGSTTILKLKYSPAYPEGSNIQVNNGTFSFGERAYYKNGDTAESHTGSSTDYNAYYNSETGVLELKGYEGGYINISSATPREITIRLTDENTITADKIFGGSGNIYYGINMRDMKKINFTGDGTLNVNVEAPGSSAAAGIFIGKSGASVTNAQLNFKDTAKVKIDVSEKNDGSSNSYNVSAIDASAMANGFAVTVDEGADLDMNITSPYATTYGIYLPTDEKAAAAINGGFHLKMKCNGTSGSATSFKSFSTSKGTFTIGEKASVSVEMPSGVNHDMENFKVEAAGSNLVSSLLSGSYAVTSYETEDFRMIKSDPDAAYLRYGSFDYMSKAGAIGVSGVSVTSDKDSLSNGDTATASATVSPVAATYPGVTWSSGNKDLAAVDKDGKITAASSGSGKVAITATSKFNRLKSGSTAVTVGTLDDNKIYEITGITVAQPVVGAKPDTAESVTVAEGFTISAVLWSYSHDGGKSWAELSSSDVFEAGKEYRVKLDISKTTEGKTYAAKEQTVAWVNGEAVQAGDIKSDGTIAYFTYNLGQPSASITKQPESQTVSCYTSEPVTLSCEVTLPEGQTAEYQWYVYYNNAWMPAWIAGDGDKSSTLTIINRSFESLQFYCKITVKEGDTEVETLQTNSARIKLVHSESNVTYNNTGSSSQHKKICSHCTGSLDEAHTLINIVTREATSSLAGTYNKECTKCRYTSTGHTYEDVNSGTVTIYLEGLPGGTQTRNIKALKSGTVEDTSNPPTKAGYTFLGWSLTEGASTPDINVGQSILFTGDTSYYEKNHFYAVWELSASGTVTTLDVDNTSQSGANWSWTVDTSNKTANLTLTNYSGGGFSIDGMDNSSNKYDITVTMIGNNEMAVTKDSTDWKYGIKVLTASGNSESTANSLTFVDGTGNGTGNLSIRSRLSESGTQYAIQAEKIPSLTVESGTLNIDMGAMIGSQTLYGIYCSGYGDNSSTDGMFTLGENAVLNISGDMAGWSGGNFYGIRTNNGDIYGKLNIEADGTKSFIAAGIDAANGASRIVNFNGKEDVIISLPQSGNSRAVAANTVNYQYRGDNWTTAVEAPEGGKVNGNHYYIGDETGSLKFTDIETYYYGENITVVKNHYYGGSVSEYSSLRYHYFETPCTGADDVKHKDTDGNYECDNCHQRLIMGDQPAQTGTVDPGDGASATVKWTLQSIYDSEQINALQTSPQIYFKVKRDGQWSGSWISIDSLDGYTDPDLTAEVGSDGRSITFTQEEGSEKAQQYELKLQLKYWFENDPTCYVKTETLPFLVTFGNTVDVNLTGITTPTQGQTAAQVIDSIIDFATGVQPTGFTVTDVSYFDNVSNSWITNETFEAGQNVTIYLTCIAPEGTTLKKENVTLNGNKNEEDIYIDSNVTEIPQDDGSTAYRYRIIWNYGEPKPETPLPEFESYQQSKLPNGSVDELYLYTFSYTGSDEGLEFSISDGKLPEGIMLNENGMLTGSPEVGGTFTFKVKITNDYVTDPADCAEKEFTLYVDAPLTVVCVQYPEAMNGERIAFLDDQVTVSVERKATDYDVFYTTDGNDPNPGSSNTTQIAKGTKKVYQQLIITANCTLKAQAFENDESGNYTAKSEIYSMVFEKIDELESGREPEVKASRESGTFAETFDLSLEAYKPDTSVRGDVKIYYTTDGSNPNVTLNEGTGVVELGGSTKEYNSPITIGHNSEDEIYQVVVKAVAVLFSKTGYKIAVSSVVKELTFTEVNGVTVSGTVKGYNSSNAPVVTLYDATDTNHETPIVTAAVETAVASGGQYTWNFSFTAVSTGTYDLVVTKAGHLTYTITGVNVESSDIDLTSSAYDGKAYQLITLLAGDIKVDGTINIKDLSMYKSNSADADLNGDGNINIKDLAILKLNMGKTATEDCINIFN